MIEVTINIPGLKELAEALVLLAGAKNLEQQIGAQPVPAAATAVPAQQTAPAQTAPIQAAPVQTAPVTACTAPMQQTAPIQSVPVQTASTCVVPTTAVGQEYTQDQLAVAMTGLVDQGKMQAVMGILARMGAQALTEIPKERYPELAIFLREAGAVI